MVVVLVVFILESIRQAISHGSIQQETDDFKQFFNRQTHAMPSYFVKDLMQLRHNSGTFKTGASLHYYSHHSARCSKHRFVVKQNNFQKNRVKFRGKNLWHIIHQKGESLLTPHI